MLVGAAGITVPFWSPRIVWAQGVDIEREIKGAASSADNLLKFIQKQPLPFKPDFQRSFVLKEYKIATTFAKASFGTPNEVLRKYIHKDLGFLYDLYEKNSVMLVQSPDKIKQKNPNPLPNSDTEKDKFIWVMIDVVLDTFDLSEFKEVVKSLLDEYPPARKLVHDMAKGIGLKDWEHLLRLSFRLFNLLLEAGTAVWIVERFGSKIKNQFVKKVLKVAAQRIIPFIGWPLLGVGFIFAVKNNYERIKNVM